MKRAFERMAASSVRRERIAAAGVIIAAIGLAVSKIWVFQPGDEVPTDGSLVRAILTDRLTLGFVRLLVTAAALYALASIAVLVLRGRWLRSISTMSIEADTGWDSDRAISELEDKLRRAQAERDEASRLLWRFLNG
jgi:hypothetical protein